HALPQAQTANGKRPSQTEDIAKFDLVGTDVTDAGLKELADLKRLTVLVVKKEQVTDGALKSLREVELLHALPQARTAGIKRPTKIGRASCRERASTAATVVGLKEQADLKKITTVNLGKIRVNDRVVKTLAEIGLVN